MSQGIIAGVEALARTSCAEHPDRHAHAVCVTCRKPLCQECATQWEGIHYCRACVVALTTAPVRKTGAFRLVFMIVWIVVLALAFVRLAVGIGVYLVGTF